MYTVRSEDVKNKELDMKYFFLWTVLPNGEIYDRFVIPLFYIYTNFTRVLEMILDFVKTEGIKIEDWFLNIDMAQYEILILRSDPNVIDETRVKDILGDKVVYCSLDDNDA